MISSQTKICVKLLTSQIVLHTIITNATRRSFNIASSRKSQGLCSINIQPSSQRGTTIKNLAQALGRGPHHAA